MGPHGLWRGAGLGREATHVTVEEQLAEVTAEGRVVSDRLVEAEARVDHVLQQVLGDVVEGQAGVLARGRRERVTIIALALPPIRCATWPAKCSTMMATLLAMAWSCRDTIDCSR